ncbi:Phage tail sheath protein FI (fragment) [Candidatus Sulfopaludibacter sp. SbA3]
MVLDHCDQAANRFAILDSLRGGGLRDALEAQWRELTGKNAALYFPWVWVADQGKNRLVPACGHIAGVYARTDAQSGVYKAPANEVVEGVLDLETSLTSLEQTESDPQCVINCLRAFPGRGIRVWGARTVSGQPEWQYVNIRRLFLTVARWAEEFMADVVMEPNTTQLQGRIRREVNDYLYKLFCQGALQGASPEEAYYLKCDSRTTSPTDREEGRVIVEMGLAPVVPNEFIVVRLIHGAGGVTMAGPGEPA